MVFIRRNCLLGFADQYMDGLMLNKREFSCLFSRHYFGLFGGFVSHGVLDGLYGAVGDCAVLFNAPCGGRV